MRKTLLIVGCIAALSAAVAGCGDDGGMGGPNGDNGGGNAENPGGNNTGGRTYCEVTCGCSARFGAPASIVEQCVSGCSAGGGSQFDSCPGEVSTFGACLDNTSNCDSSQCTEQLNALTECVFGD